LKSLFLRVAELIERVLNLKVGHATQAVYSISRVTFHGNFVLLGHSTILLIVSVCTKFEISSYYRYIVMHPGPQM